MVSGGETYVAGPNDGGNSAMDCNGSAKVTGGIFIASGSSSMASSFGEESTQGAMMVSINASEGKNKIELLDSKDKSLLTWTTTKGFDSVIISCPDIKKGSEYTVKVGDESVDVKMDCIVYGSGSGRGAGGKGGMKGEVGSKGKGRSGF